MHGFGFIALAIGFHQNNTVSTGFRLCIRVCEAENQHMRANGPVADHHLAAVNHIVIAVLDRGCSGCSRIATGIRFGDGKA